MQLVHGEKLELAFDDFDYWIRRFSTYPLVQLIDLDAAMRQGDNRASDRADIKATAMPGWRRHRHRRKGRGGIARRRQARDRRVGIISCQCISPMIPSSAVDTEFAAALSKAVGVDQIVCGVDTKQGRIAVKGWKEQIQLTPDEAIAQLEPFCAAFLYTHIDKEGTMQGFPMEVAERLRPLTNVS